MAPPTADGHQVDHRAAARTALQARHLRRIDQRLWNKLMRLGLARPGHRTRFRYRALATAERSRKTRAVPNPCILQPTILAGSQPPVATSNVEPAAKQLPTILTTNIRSLQKQGKAELLTQLIEDMNANITCITETWAHKDNIDMILHRLGQQHHVLSDERVDTRGGGTMIMVNKNYANSITRIDPATKEPPSWLQTAKPLPEPPDSQHGAPEDGALELTIAKLRQNRLPRGFSAIIVICAYLPAWTVSKQRSAIFQLIHSIEDAVNESSKNGQPLIIISGDLNGADTSPLCNAYKLRQINKESTRGDNVLDVILTNGPICYTANNHQCIGSFDHMVVVAKAPASAYRSTRPKSTKINPI